MEREREAIKFVFFARFWRRGEPINKTGDEGQRNVGRKKERKGDLSLTNFQRLPDRPTEDGVTLGAHLGRKERQGEERKGFMSCES